MSDARNASTTESSDVSSVVAALQAEVAQLRLESATTIAELRQTLATLREENQVLLRRLYGNKSERLHTDETQLAFADLLKDKHALQRQLNALLDESHAGSIGRWRLASRTREAQGWRSSQLERELVAAQVRGNH